MGKPGPRPKAVRAREDRTQHREQEFVHVVADGQVRGPELPDGDWPDATVRWWQTWRTSAQAQGFSPTDWDFLLDTALLHRALWLGDTRVASELRLRLVKFGPTEDDRARLRVRIDDPATARVSDTTRRARLLALTDERTT